MVFFFLIHKMKEQTEILRTDHNIQYSPKSIQKTVNMNNVFSKCPGLHMSTRRDEKEISFQRPVHSQMKTEKAACALRRKTSSSHGSLENKDLAWRGVRSTFFFPRWTSWLLVFEWFLKTLAEGPSSSCQGNRCAESETGEEKILKALEHHQTGEASTHEQVERALRSSRASLNDSLSVYRAAAVQHRIFLSAWTRVSGIWFSLICSFHCQWFIPPVLSYPPCV